METDLRNQLNIQDFNGQVMNGSVSLKGIVSWKDHVAWDIKGRLDRLNPKNKIIPQVAQDFLPPTLDANLSSIGSMEKGLALNAQLAFDPPTSAQVMKAYQDELAELSFRMSIQ